MQIQLMCVNRKPNLVQIDTFQQNYWLRLSSYLLNDWIISKQNDSICKFTEMLHSDIPSWKCRLVIDLFLIRFWFLWLPVSAFGAMEPFSTHFCGSNAIRETPGSKSRINNRIFLSRWKFGWLDWPLLTWDIWWNSFPLQIHIFLIKHIYLARKFESVWNMEYVDSCSIHYIKLQILLTYCHKEFLKPLNQDSFKVQKDKKHLTKYSSRSF